jgi:peptide/nickel transport system substrate-binding protein
LGNAANRIELSLVSTGTYAYGGYPDLDELFRQQAVERDRGKREALLHQIQRLMQDRVMYAPIFDSVPLHGVGPRVEEPAVGLNPLLYFTAPYEDMRLKRP